MTIPEYAVPLEDTDIQNLILLYAASHESFTEDEVRAFVQSYEEYSISKLTLELTLEGKLCTSLDPMGEVLYRPVGQPHV